MELHQALSHVSEIREHLARTEVFRGYRSITVGFSGCVGLATAAVQAILLPRPLENLNSYLVMWVVAAVVSVGVVGVEMWLRAMRAQTTIARRATLFAVEQFMPTLVAGALLTLVIAQRASEVAWMLPGLWSLLFGLGVFASCRLLPRPVAVVGLWYLVAGVFALTWGQGDAALSPWSMAIAFGGGQCLAAGILHVTLERTTSNLGS